VVYRTVALVLTFAFATASRAPAGRSDVPFTAVRHHKGATGCPQRHPLTCTASIDSLAKGAIPHSEPYYYPLPNHRLSDLDKPYHLSNDPSSGWTERDPNRRLSGAVAQVSPERRKQGNAGFRPIFNGRDLTGWDGNPEYWTVEGGAITGRTTADKPLPYNTFLIWRGKQVADFELKLEFRLEGTNGWANSGIQYRSHELPDVGKWVLGGYQADIDLSKRYLGILYEERGRGILALRGQRVIIRPAQNMLKRRRPFRIEVVGKLGDPNELVADIDLSKWNTYRIIARGNHLVHIINGRKMVEVTDEDSRHRAGKGLIGLQLHRGRPMKVQFRNIYLKEY